MAIPPVTAPNFVTAPSNDLSEYHLISRMAEHVASKLKLSSTDKTEYHLEICRDVGECIFQSLNQFSEMTASLIRKGSERTSSFLLFIILASYVAGPKKGDLLPPFLANLFTAEEKVRIEHDRRLIRAGQPSFFSFKPGANLSFTGIDWIGLDMDSPKEKIAAIFLRSDLRPVDPNKGSDLDTLLSELNPVDPNRETRPETLLSKLL